MGFLDSNNLEGLKGAIYNSYINNNYSDCIQLSNELIQKSEGRDDITYSIYGYIFKGLSNELLNNIENAIDCYLIVDDYNLTDDIVLDDLWVYFFLGLAKTQLYYFNKKEYSFEEIYNVTKRGFDVFPENEMDFNHDLENNLRLGIIKKYIFIIEYIFNPFKLYFRFITKEDGTIKNTGLVDENNKLVAMFGYKRTDFYGNKYKSKEDKI